MPTLPGRGWGSASPRGLSLITADPNPQPLEGYVCCDDGTRQSDTDVVLEECLWTLPCLFWRTRSTYSASEKLLGHYGYLPGIYWEAMHHSDDCMIVICVRHDQASWTARRLIRGINAAKIYCLPLSVKTKKTASSTNRISSSPQTPPASLLLSK